MEITEEIKEEMKTYLEANDNENTIIQILWTTAKAILRGNFIIIKSYHRKQERYQINYLKFYLKQLEKEQTIPKLSRRKGAVKIRSEINETEMKKTIVKINETKNWFLEKINKIDYLLAILIKKQGRELKSTKLEIKKEKLQL